MAQDSGYVSEIGYTYGYYRELNPAVLRFACLNAGVASPTGSLNYLELGYGQGVSINVHAAAFTGEFWGTDYSPSQAAYARHLASEARSGAMLLDESFQEFAARPDLPEFDIITLHGIWSWIDDDGRRAIVDLINRRLRVGGIVCLSYNCLPGWATSVPLRHLLALHAEKVGGGDIAHRVSGALGFAQRIVDAGAFHFRVNTTAIDRLKLIAGQDRTYVTHEFFNREWSVMPFSDVVRWLGGAKMSFIASAHLLDNIDEINLPPEWMALLAEIQHPVLRQTVYDYLLNRQFRRDIFVKEPRRLSAAARAESLRAQSFALTVLAQ